jgi:hypothetical protein
MAYVGASLPGIDIDADTVLIDVRSSRQPQSNKKLTAGRLVGAAAKSLA